MSLRDKIEAVLYDFLPDKDEREGILNNICYYTAKHSKGAFIAGAISGAVGLAILLQWLA